MDSPPRLPPKLEPPAFPKPAAGKPARSAAVLNLFLPGAGQFYLGRRWIGILFAGLFLGCCVAALLLFFVGYARYLTLAMGSNLLKGDTLEKIGRAFHFHWLFGLIIASVVIYLASLVELYICGQEHRASPPA